MTLTRFKENHMERHANTGDVRIINICVLNAKKGWESNRIMYALGSTERHRRPSSGVTMSEDEYISIVKKRISVIGGSDEWAENHAALNPEHIAVMYAPEFIKHLDDLIVEGLIELDIANTDECVDVGAMYEALGMEKL